MKQSQIYAYIRVSSKDQNEDRQLDALASYNIPKRNYYIDKQSGKNFDRPAYKRLIKRLKPGDLLIVKSIDRLGRNYTDIIEQWRIITKEKKADIKIIDMPLLDTTYGKDLLGTFIADLTLQVMSFAAQLERENIRQRQAEGIAAAQARGIRWGNKEKKFPEDFDVLYDKWKKGEMNTQSIMECCDMKRTAFYKHLKEYEMEKQMNLQDREQEGLNGEK